jgi:lipid-A-disaccharide synthase
MNPIDHRMQPIMIVAGEASGDAHGARLVRALRKKNPHFFFCGIGGQALRAEGVRVVLDAEALSVVGITEVLSKLASLRRGIRLAKMILRSLHPDLLILIDFPDFNLHLAKTAKNLGIPTLYYVSPQIWAWRSGRVRQIKRRVDHMAVILPFETRFYRRHNVPATFVGHPLLDFHTYPKHRPEKDPVDAKPVIIGLFPGSRSEEVIRHLPPMLAAAQILSARYPDAAFIVSVAASIDESQLAAVLSTWALPDKLELARADVNAIFERCTLIVAVSGTVTLEAAIWGVPMVIVYKVSLLSYWLGRLMIRVNHIGLVNLIFGETVVPELIQDDVSPRKIADQVSRLLADPGSRKRMRDRLMLVRNLLGGPGASQRVADIALNLLKKQGHNNIL